MVGDAQLGGGYLLITGVSGFVGEHLARRVRERHEKVAGTFLSTPIVIPGVDTVPLDATDGAAVLRLVRDMRPTAIVHCAAQTNTSWCEDHPTEARHAIVDATANLVRAVRERAPETPVIGFSTDLVFDGRGAPYAEDAAPAPLNVYGKLKRESEGNLLSLPRGMVLRSALVYGPPSTHRDSFLSWMVGQLARWEDLALFEDEWRTPVFVDDLADAVWSLLGLPAGEQRGVFHAGGPDRLSRLEMGRRVAEVFGLPEQPIRATLRSDVHRGHLRASDVSLTSGRLRAANWNPTSFDDGLRACLQRWSERRPANLS
jgi:dTDP-4-dehydrorhamnose reductase